MAQVRETIDFTRIAELPRRVLSLADAEAWAEALTPELRREGSSASLRPWQALALAEAAEQGGAYLALPVGLGKTLICELLPVVMGARRPVLIIPASLREKTYADRAALSKDWILASPPPRVISREELATEAGAYLLDEIGPDLIIIDEADELANPERGAPRRIDRYVVAQQEAVRVVCLTGTPSRKSILGYWHHLLWCLRDRAPVPMEREEASLWALALDEKPAGQGRRAKPGPLGASLEAARAWYRARLLETPGVIVVDGDSAADIPLRIEVLPARECTVLDEHFRGFLVDGEVRGGVPVADPLDRYRVDMQLGAGLLQYYDPAPPEAWATARRAFCAWSRATIDRSQHYARPLDTEAQVVRRYPDHPIVKAWQEVRPTFEPRTAVEWLSASALESAEEWLASDDTPGIVWCGVVEFAEALAARTRLPYYSRQGKDASGRGLHAADTSRSLIASWQANKRGFNLQAWRRALIVAPPSSAKYLEQIIGRSHRAGQDQEVAISILATSGGTIDAFLRALAEAGFARDTVGLSQKALRAEVVVHPPRINASNKFRWAQKPTG